MIYRRQIIWNYENGFSNFKNNNRFVIFASGVSNSGENRSHEFKLHVRGALNNGLSKLQIRDVVLQITIYCGAPAGLESLRLIREVFKEVDAEK